MKQLAILYLTLFLIISCDVAAPTTVLPPQNPDVETTFEVTLDYEDRAYEIGETVEALLKITQRDNATDHFLMTISCSGGLATGTLDNEDLSWGKEQILYYEQANESESSRILHLGIIPILGQEATQNLTLKFNITSPDKNTSKSITMQILSVYTNTAPIAAWAEYDDTAIEINTPLLITLYSEKDDYKGSFSIKPRLIKGSGFFSIDGSTYSDGEIFSIPAESPCEIHYTPTSYGIQEFSFIISDAVCATITKVQFEVINQGGGITMPKNGIYIYADGQFFSREVWTSDTEKTPTGIAILADDSKFLLAPNCFAGYWCNYSDDFFSLPGLTVTEGDLVGIAKTDFNGRKNTEALVLALSRGEIKRADLAKACYDYDNNNPGKWYLPAAGQMYIILQNLAEINKCLKLIGGQTFIYNYYYQDYVSSTGMYTTHSSGIKIGAVWSITTFGTLTHTSPQNSTSHCYPVCDLAL